MPNGIEYSGICSSYSGNISISNSVVYLLLKSNQKEQIELLNAYLGFNDPKLYKALTKRVYGFLLSSNNQKLYDMLIKIFEKVYQLEIEE